MYPGQEKVGDQEIYITKQSDLNTTHTLFFYIKLVYAVTKNLMGSDNEKSSLWV